MNTRVGMPHVQLVCVPVLPPQVTTEGDLVHDLDSVHKKPYEILIIGGKSRDGGQASICEEKETECVRTNGEYSDGFSCTSNNVTAGADNSGLLKYSCCSCKQSNTTLVEIPQTGEECATHCCTDNQTVSDEHVTEGSLPCKRSKRGQEDTSTDRNTSCYRSHPVAITGFRGIPHHYMFMCVQSAVHSQKPYLGGECVLMV